MNQAKDTVSLTRRDAEQIAEVLGDTINRVIDASLNDVDYGDTEKNGATMETLHHLRMAQLVLERELERKEAAE
jgi:hypothetical protein